MTTCGLSSKLGKIKELNTGLIPICCSTKERRKEKYRLLFNNKNINKRNQNIKLINGKNKKLKIKPENLLTNSSYDDQIENSKLFNASTQQDTKSSSMKNKDEFDLSSSLYEVSFDEKLKANDISERKSIKLNSPSMIHETRNVNIESTKHSNPSLEMNNIDSNKISSSHDFSKTGLSSDSMQSKQFKINQIYNNLDASLSSREPSNISELLKSNDDRDQKNEC
ncbi:unnamed protein product [Rotaria sp. Silwood2]|nr:unnamed protein product [Rotaria sp. Silwood2]